MNKDPDYIMAMTIRAALVMIIRAIEKRYNIKAYTTVVIGENDSMAGLPQNME